MCGIHRVLPCPFAYQFPFLPSSNSYNSFTGSAARLLARHKILEAFRTIPSFQLTQRRLKVILA
jgi:hypothetical protein